MTVNKTEKKRKRHPNSEERHEESSLNVGFSKTRIDVYWEKNVSKPTMDAIEEVWDNNFINNDQGILMMALLESSNVVGVSQKENLDPYSFLIPALELVHLYEAKPEYGTIVIIICPTKDSAIKTFVKTKQLWKNQTDNVFQLEVDGVSIGDSTRSILVTTPDSLVNHLLQEGTERVYNFNPVFLVFDQTDYMLKHNYEELQLILNYLPYHQPRQTAIFSTTYSGDIVEFANCSCESTPVYIDVDNARTILTKKKKLLLRYSIVGKDKRFTQLYYLLKTATKFSKKTIVFFSSPQSIEFHSKLLRCFGIQCIDTENNQYTQTTAVLNFWNAKKGIFLCMESACNFDIPCMDWVVQYEPPEYPMECANRVVKPFFGQGPRGDAFFFLNFEEKKFVECLKGEEVKPYKWDLEKVFDMKDEDDVARRHSYLVDDDQAVLHDLAKDAFMSYLKAYHSHSRQDLFNVSRLDVKGIAQSFGFSFIPMKHQVESLLGRLIMD